MYAHKFGDFNFDFGEFRGGHSDNVVLCFENACEFVCFCTSFNCLFSTNNALV